MFSGSGGTFGVLMCNFLRNSAALLQHSFFYIFVYIYIAQVHSNSGLIVLYVAKERPINIKGCCESGQRSEATLSPSQGVRFEKLQQKV